MKYVLKKGLVLTLSALFSTLFITDALAASYQIFPNIAYSNAAALQIVKHEQVILGGLGLWNQFSFSGTANGIPGSVSSHTRDFLPYGRAAARLSPQVVVGIDVTDPIFTDIRYPVSSFVSGFATTTSIRDINFSPKISYQINPQWAVGLGFDANRLWDVQFNFVVPPIGQLINRGSSWAYGWDAGVSYAMSRATIFNLAYYSKIIQHINGTSTWGPFSTSASAKLLLPATYIFNVIQFLSLQWMLSGTLRYVDWNPLRFTTIKGTPIGNIVVPNHYFGNVGAELATLYNIDEKWGVMGAISYDGNVQPEAYRNIGLPAYKVWVFGVGGQYAITKALKAKLLYAYAYSRPPISLTGLAGTITGQEKVNVNAVDFSITFDC